MTSTLEVQGLVATVGARDHLVGARCGSCDTHTFPLQAACPRCGAEMSQVPLPDTGTLWSWTVQRIRPKPPYAGPDEHEPFAVGYVDLGPLKVEGRLEGRDPGSWEIGTPVQLRPGPRDEDGNVWTYRIVEATS